MRPLRAALPNAMASRLAVRLAELSNAQLLEIAVAGCEASSAVTNKADAILAAHKPLPLWAVEGVLLSSDLMPHVLAPLQLEDGAAAAVCSRWANGWKATSEGRRRLRQVAFDFPQELLDKDNNFELVVIPHTEQLVVMTGTMWRILDHSMHTVTSFDRPDDNFCGPIAADEQSIYAAHLENQCLCRLTHDGTTVAEYVFQNGYSGLCIVLAPVSSPSLAPDHGQLGGLLFCTELDETEGAGHEILALDAQSLQLRYRFGQSLLKDAGGLTVIGDELFVCDGGNNRLQVFSLAGEHRRSITGEWNAPAGLCFAKDRLYLIESGLDEQDSKDPLQGRRIFVLSLQGETLQVYTMPLYADEVLYFDGKLLVTLISNLSQSAVPYLAGGSSVPSVTGVIALAGV
jgi:hypothetical protein